MKTNGTIHHWCQPVALPTILMATMVLMMMAMWMLDELFVSRASWWIPQHPRLQGAVK